MKYENLWMIESLVTFVIGFSLLFILINNVIWGASLILLSLVILFVGLILPEKTPKIVHQHHDTIIEERHEFLLRMHNMIRAKISKASPKI